jgi:hypothetical protein
MTSSGPQASHLHLKAHKLSHRQRQNTQTNSVLATTQSTPSRLPLLESAVTLVWMVRVSNSSVIHWNAAAKYTTLQSVTRFDMW